jgi:hypothetical protein
VGTAERALVESAAGPVCKASPAAFDICRETISSPKEKSRPDGCSFRDSMCYLDAKMTAYSGSYWGRSSGSGSSRITIS